MQRLSIAFEWKKDTKGYRLRLNERDEPALLIRNGGDLVPYNPLEISGLYGRFAEVKDAAALLAFVNTYGPLSKAGLLQAPSPQPRVRNARGREIKITETDAGENVHEALVHAAWFRNVLSLRPGSVEQKAYIGAPKPLKLAEGRLVSDTQGYRIEYRPKTLIDAMRIQLALMLIDGKGLAYCACCHEPSEAGGNSGKRADAKFCSKEHRIRYNSLKRTRP
jgi:hypothetical protein